MCTVFVEASDSCHSVNFDINEGESSSRTWDIKVTQYECSNEMAGKTMTTMPSRTLASTSFLRTR